MAAGYAITEAEALKIANAKNIVDRIGKTNCINVEHCQLYKINERMLLVLIPVSAERVEAHIAEPEQYISKIHKDVECSKYLIGTLGYSEIVTTVDKKYRTTINLLKKHGFDIIGETLDKVEMLWD